MRKSSKLTIAQFAKLHDVNKRTLHYYDAIGLFSPSEKGENQYRYYDSSQSMTFEYIRMLKELNMSLEEIKAYLNHPNPIEFIGIAQQKSAEIDRQIVQLRQAQQLLLDKMRQIELCESQKIHSVHVIHCKQERFLTVPYGFENNDIYEAFSHVKDIWGIQQCRAGIGSYLSVDKIMDQNFEQYDGLYSPVSGAEMVNDVMVRPAGSYLCTYVKGTWDRLPQAYDKIVSYAKKHHFTLVGYAFEWGMNDFVIADAQDSITQILIAVK